MALSLKQLSCLSSAAIYVNTIIYINSRKMSLVAILNKLKRNKSFKYGVPFLILMVGGSFGLQEFTRIRYQFSKQQTVTPDEMEDYGISMKKPKEVTIDKIYETVKNLNLDDWENKRGPRPWEENFDNK